MYFIYSLTYFEILMPARLIAVDGCPCCVLGETIRERGGGSMVVGQCENAKWKLCAASASDGERAVAAAAVHAEMK